MPQGHISLLADDPRIHVHDHPQCSESTPGQDRNASGRLKDIPDGYMDLVETHGWGLRIFIFLADVSLSLREFY